jgi:plasmid stabilization system protein ParE
MIVRYRRRAQDDVDNIYRHLATKNPAWPYQVDQPIRSAGLLLTQQPEMGVATDDLPARRWSISHYGHTIFYEINSKKDCIEVLRVLDGKRVRNVRRVPR